MFGYKLKTFGQGHIGLDIGHDYIKMIQLCWSKGNGNIVAADKVRIDPNINGDDKARAAFVADSIKQMLAKGGFTTRKVVSCLPNDKLRVSSVRLGETDISQIEQIVKKEVSQRFGMDPENDIINYVIAGDVMQGDETKTEIILFAADSKTSTSHIEMLENAGLRPVSIETVPSALYRSFERLHRRQEDKERTVLLIDVGSKFTTVVFGRNGEVSFVKQIAIGGDRFKNEIAGRLGINLSEAESLRNILKNDKADNQQEITVIGGSDETSANALDASTRHVITDAVNSVAEELTREISLCFRYYTVTFRGRRVERATISGGEAYENILLNALRRQLTVEIEIAQPLRGFDTSSVKFDNDRRGLLCEWSVAVGLGLKGCQ